MAALTVSVECEYRLIVNGKKIAMTRADMIVLRDTLNGLLKGDAIPESAAGSWTSDRWSDADDEKLRTLIGRGKPFAFVAHELGRTEAACRTRHQKIQSLPAAS